MPPSINFISEDGLRVLKGRVQAVLQYIDNRGVIADPMLIKSMLTNPEISVEPNAILETAGGDVKTNGTVLHEQGR